MFRKGTSMRYESTTTLTMKGALERAEQFFGGEYGLTVNVRNNHEIGFTGGGGHVIVKVIHGQSTTLDIEAHIVHTQPTTLDIETREWDAAVQSFLGQLPR
jgi:hypothetical protein